MFNIFRRKDASPSSTRPDWEDALPPNETERIHRILGDFTTTPLEKYCAPDQHDYELWREGRLAPSFITTLLDMGHHVGPHVDHACNANEPEVDLWEVGRIYPRWDQTVALAQFLGIRVRNLGHPEIQPHHHPNRPHRRMVPTVVILSFEPSAVDEVTEASSPLMPLNGKL